MKALVVVALLVSAGQCNPLGLDQSVISKTIRQQSAQLAENNLLQNQGDQCLKRALCGLGTTKDITEWPKLSLGAGLENLQGMLSQMVDDIQDTFKDSAEMAYPNIHQAVAR